MRSLRVPVSSPSLRLDVFLVQALPPVSRRQAREMIAAGAQVIQDSAIAEAYGAEVPFAEIIAADVYRAMARIGAEPVGDQTNHRRGEPSR